jgi:hypothetical protein
MAKMTKKRKKRLKNRENSKKKIFCRTHRAEGLVNPIFFRENSELNCAHLAEGLVNPKVRAKILVTDFGYPRACRFRKHQILNRSPELPLPT